MNVMRPQLWMGVCALAMSVVSSAGATTRTKVTILNGAQETPPVATPAGGCGRFEIDTATNRLRYHIVYSDLTTGETAAHLHGPAGPGAAGGVVHPLPAGSPKIGTWAYPEALESAILKGEIYVNIHTTMNPGGELRGQIVDMVAQFNGEQEAPPTGSSGDGYGLFNLNTVSNELSYYIEVLSLDGVETNAHIHGFALHGTSAGVIHPLGVGALKTGTFPYVETQEEAILEGRAYVNIHSTIDPGGEIRGQITRNVSPGDGTQEVPPTGTRGYSCTQVAYDDSTDRLSYMVTHAGLTGPATAAHFHGYAGPGVNAGVVQNIGPATPNVGVWSYPAAREADIFAGLTYVNVHTALNPGGEVRGQVLFAGTPCPADIDCDGAVAFGDLLAILGAWGTSAGAEDIDCNGTVNFGDILVVLGDWGPCP